MARSRKMGLLGDDRILLAIYFSIYTAMTVVVASSAFARGLRNLGIQGQWPYWMIFGASTVSVLWLFARKAGVLAETKLSQSAFGNAPQWKGLLWALFAVYVVRVVFSVTTPLNIDELQQISEYSMGLTKGVQNHFLTMVLSRNSMKIFGINELGARLPSLLFALALGSITTAFYLRRKTPFIGALILAQLLCNAAAFTLLPSVRSYSPMLCLAGLLFYLALQVTSTAKPRYFWFKYAIIVVSLILILLTHLFAALFVLVLFSAWALWLYQTKDDRSLQPCRRNVKYLLWASVLAIPLFIFCTYRLTTRLSGLQLLGAYDLRNPYRIIEIYYSVLGYCLGIWPRILFGVTLLLFGFYFSTKKNKSDFAAIFNAVSLGTVFVAVVIFGPKELWARFLLPFLIPTLHWFFSYLPRWKKIPCTLATGAFGILFFVVPAFEANQIERAQIAQAETFHRFVAELNYLDPNFPWKSDCITCEGNPIYCAWVVRPHRLIAMPTAEQSDRCQVRYHFRFTRDILEYQHFQKGFPKPPTDEWKGFHYTDRFMFVWKRL